LNYDNNNSLLNEYIKQQKEINNKKYYHERTYKTESYKYVKELQFIANSFLFVIFLILFMFANK